ncbi:hypothetical protein VPH35_105880 [Triticum aestivum]
MLCVSSPALDMIAQYFRYWSPLCSFSLEYLGFSLNHFVLWYFGVCSFNFPTEIVHGYALLGDKFLRVVRFPSVSDEIFTYHTSSISTFHPFFTSLSSLGFCL